MDFEEIIFLLAVVISCFGNSQSLPISLKVKEPSLTETNLLWNGQKYCLRFLTMDAIGTESDLKEAIDRGLKFLDREKESRSNSDISKNIINHEDHTNADPTGQMDYKTADHKKLRKDVYDNAFSSPSLENRFKNYNEYDSSKTRENNSQKDIINVIFVTPKSRTGDEIVFPTEINYEYDENGQTSTGVNFFDRVGEPAALVASLLG